MDNLPFYEDVLADARQKKNVKAEASALGALGNIYAGRGEFRKGLEFHEQSLKLNEQLNYKDGVAMCCVNIASIYEVGFHDLSTAVTWFERAVRNAESPQLKERYSQMLKVRQEELRRK